MLQSECDTPLRFQSAAAFMLAACLGVDSGCSARHDAQQEAAQQESTSKTLEDREHQHYHVHGRNISHEHDHANGQRSAHVHIHQHAANTD